MVSDKAASEASGVAGTAVGSEEPITSERKVARPEGIALTTLGLRNQERIEVLWDVEMDDGADEKVWWGAVLQAEEAPGEVGEGQLIYEAQHGFDVETRRVLFVGGGFLWDTALRERLPYRREGEAGPELGEEGEDEAGEDETDGEAVDPLFAVGASVKARFQGGDMYCAGTVQVAHADGAPAIVRAYAHARVRACTVLHCTAGVLPGCTHETRLYTRSGVLPVAHL